MPTQQQRSEKTQSLLLNTFRSIALKQGVEAATTDAVLEKTGLSKGALYHHFKSKIALAEEVYRTESHNAIRRALERGVSGGTAIEDLKAVCVAWLSEVRKPDVRKMLFEIGPSILGIRRVVEIENGLSLKLFEEGLSQANDNGEASIANPALAARLINAYVAEVALQSAADRQIADGTVGAVIDAIIQALDQQSPHHNRAL
jgi:AcrR family transcriptional regulator